MMNNLENILSQIPLIEERLSYSFEDKDRLVCAFVHRSFYNEHRDLACQHNERLEFLGDSVLGLLVSDFLYAQLPQEAEGRLSSLRSQIVEAGSCTKFLTKLQVADFVLLGKGERMNDGRGRETILADLFEALIGAIYLDGGMEAAREFFLSHFREELSAYLLSPSRNWKAELQDYSQKKHQKPPTYKVVKQTGPDHSKVFYVTAWIEDAEIGSGIGTSKKEAEQAAAEDAMKKLNR